MASRAPASDLSSPAAVDERWAEAEALKTPNCIHPYGAGFEGLAFKAACDLLLQGAPQANGYTEFVLTARRREGKRAAYSPAFSGTQIIPSAMRVSTASSASPAHGPDTQYPSSGRKRAPCAAHTINSPARSRNRCG